MPQNIGASATKLTRGVLFAYGSLSFPLAAAFIALQVIVPTFYAEYTGLSLSLIGVVLLVARLFDVATDPVVGLWSDRTQSRLGRRKVFVMAAVIPIGVSVWALFNPPQDASAYYLLFWTTAIYIAGTVLIVPMAAWGAELAPDYHQKSRVTGSRVAFGLAGSLAALLVPVVIGTDASQGYAETLKAIALLTLVTLAITSLWAAFKVPDTSDTQLPENALAEVRALLVTKNPFRQLLFSFLLNAVGNAIPSTLFLLYVTHVLGLKEMVGQLLFLYFIAAVISVPFWVWRSKRLGKHQTWSVAIVAACLFFMWAPFLTPDTAWVFVIIVGATGFATGADLALPSAINGDIIEWDELQTGYKRPGLFFALWGTAAKLSFGLAIGVAFPLLDLFDFDANGSNSESSLTALAVLYGVPCIAFKLSALWMMRGYPITESEHQRIRAALKEREANEAQEINEERTANGSDAY